MRKTLLTLLLVCTATFGFAQRVTDKIDRGLVAVPGQSGGNFISWRVFGEEYYDVTYNLYCNGSLLAQNLELSSYTHASGTASSRYQVAAVVRGVEQEKCKAVTRWNDGYKQINLIEPVDRDGNAAGSYYAVNDVSVGDLTGDGTVEFIIKRPCSDMKDTGQSVRFHHLDCYDINGKRLWWIDLGPNMSSGPDEQWDAVCYDWDQDGKAEVILRVEDNAIIHLADGSTIEIGDMNVDTRNTLYNGELCYTKAGNEYLLYLEGATGRPYQIGPSSHPNYMDYPLPRLETSEFSQTVDWAKIKNYANESAASAAMPAFQNYLKALNSAWGDTSGHRSTKHYWGAPFLDGRKASIFLGRGCYTRHKFTALDVDPQTHQLSVRWRWNCYDGSSPWFGNGYHNFAIGDVDWDGRDEIIFGSMVIDDNGLGLSTTDYGHGDAQHCSDFDPYRKGEEQFACLEEGRGKYGCNYRNATTAQIYVKSDAGADDGRALMGNFTNSYPGSVGRSVSSQWISSVADKFLSELGGDSFIDWSDLNARIYWDGDLLDEYMDSPGTAKAAVVYKPGTGSRLVQCVGSLANGSKNNPGALGDILGDWREELVLRYGDNALVIYTTNYPTDYRIPTLWHDHQYRNAMVWQSMGYNQPPHKSYFLGELEGITQAPPPVTMTGRTEVSNGGTITTTQEHLLICETNDTHITIQDGASPYMVTFNVPSWVQGTAASDSKTKNTAINTTYYTCTVQGGALTGGTRLIKQGEGILTLPAVDMTYTGETNVWAGTVNFNGSAQNSPVWLNRFGELNSNAESATFKSLKADYASIVRPGGENAIGTITATESYHMGFGSRLVLDLYSDGLKADKVVTSYLTIEKKNWKYGPQYLMPVIEVVEHKAEGAETLEPGRYLIAHVDSISGSLANIKVEGVTSLKSGLELDEKGDIYLVLGSVRGASEIVWTGASSNVWDYATSENFYLADDETQTPDIFVKGDIVNFTDSATSFTVTLKDGIELPADTIRFDNTKAYTFNGGGKIVSGAYVKENTGTVTMTGDNTYTGGNYLRGGITKVSSLSNSTQAYGNLGGLTTLSTNFTIENAAELQTTADVKMGSPMRMLSDEGGVINNSKAFVMEKLLTGTKLTKKGAGTLTTQGSLGVNALTVAAGTFQHDGSAYNKKVTMQGTSTLRGDGFIPTPIEVDAKANATYVLTNTYYQAHSGKLTGSGTITFTPTNTVSRVRITGDWSAFTGTVKHTHTSIWLPLDNSTGLPNGTLDIAEGATVTNTAKAWTIGKLTGKGNLGHPVANFQNSSGISGSNTWNVGNSWESNGDFTYAGAITDDGGTNKAIFNKVGTCKMTVSGKWSNSGAVTVKEGVLHLNKATLGTGSLTVAKGASLTGYSALSASQANDNPMTNSIFTINGLLQCGSNATATSGFFNFNKKNVTFGATGTLRVGLNKCATESTPGCATIYNINRLTMNDGATISVFLGKNYTPTTDETKPDSFRIFSDVTTVKIGTLNFDLPELPIGNYWDTSKISEGYLYVYYKPVDGDINGDGKLDAADIVAMFKMYLGLEPQSDKCDLNGDGAFTLADITMLVKLIAQ